MQGEPRKMWDVEASAPTSFWPDLPMPQDSDLELSILPNHTALVQATPPSWVP